MQVKNPCFIKFYLLKKKYKTSKIITRSARMRALSGVPTPTAISLIPAESNLGIESFKTEASSQLIDEERKEDILSANCVSYN